LLQKGKRKVNNMSILYWVVFGLIAGSIANFISPTSQGGIVGSIILGIVGAIVGGYLGERFLGVGVTGFNVMSFVVAVSGALLMIFISRLLISR
jgi:uncharacterized membrane protein YeaQ/YmgE (transglycosylase-associated protein family)